MRKVHEQSRKTSKEFKWWVIFNNVGRIKRYPLRDKTYRMILRMFGEY